MDDDDDEDEEEECDDEDEEDEEDKYAAEALKQAGKASMSGHLAATL